MLLHRHPFEKWRSSLSFQNPSFQNTHTEPKIPWNLRLRERENEGDDDSSDSTTEEAAIRNDAPGEPIRCRVGPPHGHLRGLSFGGAAPRVAATALRSSPLHLPMPPNGTVPRFAFSSLKFGPIFLKLFLLWLFLG